MTNLENFWKDIQKGVVELAEQNLKDYKDSAINDGLAFIVKGKEKISLWVQQLADGEINQNDFEFLFNSQKDLMEMQALTKLGLAKARMDQFKSDLVNLVISKGLKTII